ncbi:hypothetical protein GI584_11575 [Gracilibacillus salitolerans]|uniref:Uncharacterized protein n=1 Tax=Gracilibacillus salitolerans TaxID=2663022 RepID=A0A5Q2TKI8_9BACI|nr:hypothetical protein [Gracilibacillus salitolerans]QGH34631.1 hypothetical protein GI584_11575 [Gracilibacillus salitolerans]
MSQSQKEVEDMEKFMTVLMEVKGSLATQNEKLDTLLDLKPKIEAAYDTANSADRRSLENEKDTDRLREKISTRASKSDVERIVQEKDNWKKNLPHRRWLLFC